MARTKLKQYVDTITVDQDDLDDLAEAMSDVLKYGVIQMDDNKLANMASLTASVIGIVFNLVRPLSIAVGVVGLVASLSPNLKKQLEDNIRIAIDDMHDTRRFMKRNGYRKAKLEFPFMDYEDIRLITGKGNILRLQDKNGRWEQP
ncbi:MULTISPECIES: hypothetical protein [Brevibacillus]|jgi:hypothetical protein|uniref:Uncharacterized protein n=1 Tax=Brevibacillus parabrevis TaxID=54914 RepID=A0A4Y3PCF6_BREPA|nr:MULTISPECIES: hypothetical protein [Brevibacillus]TGV30429.1 hypothetical protein EN829_036940 [Mesorhizobium sp. M00.F.Ca.ET.186.01.1.1]MDH6351104.1 hypothetical protein [Brevibacillus sp. 1238]MED2255947.1 hypothetical protein [Brevibacillus parabrevis]NRQ53243.1 hypothetical protein [Brevibacillus sp. HD1.4A]RNB97136.1 hypothetical protein EDM60_02100 [Brevibacillus parabrevis]